MDIKVRNSCSLRITFTYPDGSKVDIRNSKFLSVTLILPDKTTKPIKDVGFDYVTGTIFVRLFGENDIQTIGAYSICINVQDKDTRMLSTVNTPIFNATQNAYDGYRSIVLSLALYTVETPENIAITGASPQISPQQTWLVYDDTLKSYIDTGIRVRGDSAFQTWLQQPGNEGKTYEDYEAWLRHPATEAGQRADEAAERAHRAADNADEAADNADEATKNANKATAAAKVATENAKIITGEAQEATNNAIQATNNLESIKSDCITATDNANTAASEARISSNDARDKAEAAREATTKAQEATNDAIQATTKASESTQEAKEAAQEAREAAQRANDEADVINNKLDKTGDGESVYVTFDEVAPRSNVASGDKLSVLFGKIKRWFSDLKTVAFTGKASDLSQDAGNRLVTDTEKAGWNDKYTRAEVDTKDAGKANLVHTHTKAQITDFPTALPANGGNADTVDNLHATDFGRAYSGYYSFGGNNNNITTSAFVDMLASLGAFDQPYWVARGSWEYENNSIISDTGIGRIHLSGCVVEVFGVRSNYTIRIITPTSDDTGAELRRVFIYINNNNGYNYGWFKLANVSDIPTSLPASDVYDWAKQANKPTYNINEIYDADSVRVDAGTVNRKIFIANHKSEGYLSRAAIGLTNPESRYSPVIISAGMDDQGNTWADWVFNPANGRITNPNGKAFAYTEEIPNVSNYLPLSGGAMAGMLSTCMMPSTFIEGMTRAAIKYNDLTAITNTAYHSFFAMKAQNNHILNFGGIGNDIGFRGYLGGRAQNGYDYRLSCNTADGSWTLEKGRFYIDGSAPEHVIMFQSFGINTGYIGFGAYPTKDLQIMNYATNKYINIAADGKLYYDNKEIATVDQITGGTIPDASTSVSGIVNTGAQEFSGRKAFRGGIDITSGGMTVNGGIAVTNGTIACTGEVSAANGFFVSSDIRLKKYIVNIRLSERRIRLCEFDKADKHSYGVIAQEVEELYPTVVKEENGYKVVNYIEVLTIKCAEQDERIEALERENSSLKERLERLEKLLLK